MTEQVVLREPNPWPQTKALSRTEKEILYWWARWGWKTDAGLAWLLRWIDCKDLRVLVLRETYDDLVDWIDRAMQLYTHFWAEKSWLPVQIKFPSGATIRTWYLKGQSYDKYKWHEYQKMIIEEVTQIPWEESYEKLLWSLRSTVDGLKPQIFLTTNPDGVGRLWVKRRFVDITKPWERYTDDKWNTRIYIPAKVQDNPVLLAKDPWYVQYLEWIRDDQLRKAWLEWDREAYDVKWAIYSSQIKQAREEWRICKVPVEKHLPLYTAWDLWINDYMSLVIFQVYWKEARVVDSYYNDWEPLDFYISRLRQANYKIEKHYLPHDANVMSRQTGKTDYDVLTWLWERCEVLPRTSDIRTDINQTRQKFPYIWFDSERARTLIEHLEIYRKERDEKHQVFKDRPYHWPESHFADAFRYMCGALDKLLQSTVKYKSHASNYIPY